MAELLKESELFTGHNYTKLFSQAPAPIAVYKGRELRYVFVNDAYSKIFNERDILGKTVRQAFPELEGQPYFEILENVFDTGEPFFGNETPALVDVANNGILTTRYYNLVYTPYKNDDGIIEGVMAFGHDVTETVEARNKERESDLRFRNIVQQSNDPILILKGENLVLDVANEALFKVWNIDSTSIGKTFLEILPEMENQGFHELLLDVLRNGKTHHGYETPAQFLRANGDVETVYFNFIYQPYREADGKISGVLVLATDVTEQVTTKHNLAQSEINFRNTILQAPVAMCVLKGPVHIVEIANTHMYELWGKKEEEMAMKPIFDALPEVKGQGFEKLLQNVFTTGQRFTANERPTQLPRNGKTETVYINFVYEPFRSGNGTITGIIVVATDVTEQVIARHKIEYAEESARLAIELADLGTYEIDLLTNETYTSPRLNIIWDFSNSMDRLEFVSRIHPDDIAVRDAAHKESLQTGNLHYEARIFLKDGTQRWVRVKGKVMHDKGGTPVRLLGVVQDITEHKVFAGELSKKVEERTRELNETNLMLERSNEELEQFAYIASHDLQEPLRKIQLFNSLVLEQPGINDAVKKYLEKSNFSANRMTGLIRDLLEYSRLSKKTKRFEETDLNQILKNVLTDFELLINQKGALIKADTLPVITAIPLQMNQLLYNLIGNALKFTKRNIIPVITITANKVAEEKIKTFKGLNKEREYIEIKVADNGIGFNEDYANKIFTIFQRLNEKSMYGGYGIGLALCRKIADNHSGIIYAEGKPKEGAAFTFILPCTQS
ncbi:MAG TPA: PAS domain-containing protein [Chitinophagaceae bacterium]|nr:PAS domain-containing protein [Chitinophagaceae bacterium]